MKKRMKIILMNHTRRLRNKIQPLGKVSDSELEQLIPKNQILWEKKVTKLCKKDITKILCIKNLKKCIMMS